MQHCRNAAQRQCFGGSCCFIHKTYTNDTPVRSGGMAQLNPAQCGTSINGRDYLIFWAGHTSVTHISPNSRPIKSSHYPVEHFIISHVTSHRVTVVRLENHFTSAFWHQQLDVFRTRLGITTHPIKPITNNKNVWTCECCIRAHCVSIKVSSQDCSKRKSSMGWNMGTRGASCDGPTVS